MSFVEQALNTDEAAPFKAFWEDEGADFVVIRRQHLVAGSAGLDISRLLKEKNKKLPRCPRVYPWEWVVLNPRGHLSFCPADWVHGSELGDFRATTIREAWNGEFYKALRLARTSPTSTRTTASAASAPTGPRPAGRMKAAPTPT